MATRTRRRPPARRRPTRRPARQITVTLGPRPHGSRRHRSASLAVGIWLARWTGRVAAWTGRQATTRTAGHYHRAASASRVWRDVKAEHGLHTPIVWGLHDGRSYPAHRVDIPAPTGGDPEVRAEQAQAARRHTERVEQARVDNIWRRVRPPRWQRFLAKLHLWRINWDIYEESLRARMAVLAQRRERLAREAALWRAAPTAAPDRWSTDPGGPSLVTVPVDLDELVGRRRTSNRTKGDGSMANPIRQWSDLADPQIDPFDFPEELPDHFTEVAKLLADEAAMIEAAADSGKSGADTFESYVEYLNTAGVDGSVIAPMVDARAAIDEAVAAIRRAAEAMGAASTHAEGAQRAAEAAYGEWEMPRFDQANAG